MSIMLFPTPAVGSGGSPTSRGRTATLAALLLLVALVGLRLECITHRPLADHEITAINFASKICPATVLSVGDTEQHIESNGILYYVGVLGPMVTIADSNKLFLRLPSVVFAAMSLWMVYLLGCRIGGRQTGFLSLFLLGVHGVHLSYSSFVRFYSLNLLLCLVSSWLLLEIVTHYQTSSAEHLVQNRKHTISLWTAYILSVTGLITTMVGSVFLMPVHWITLLVMLPNKRQAIASATLLAMFSAGLCLLLVQRDSAALHRMAYGELSMEQVMKATYNTLGTFPQERAKQIIQFWPDDPVLYITWAFAGANALVVVAGAGTFMWRSRRSPRSKPLSNRQKIKLCFRQSATLLVALWALLPLATILVFSYVKSNILNTANCLFVVPASVLIIGYFLASSPKVVRYFWIGILATQITLCLTSIPDQEGKRPDRLLDYAVSHHCQSCEFFLKPPNINLSAENLQQLTRIYPNSKHLPTILDLEYVELTKRWLKLSANEPTVVWCLGTIEDYSTIHALGLLKGYRLRQSLGDSEYTPRYYLQLWCKTFPERASSSAARPGL